MTVAVTGRAAQLRASLNYEIAALRCRTALFYLQMKFNQDEPRLPSGGAGGGQWTSGDSGSVLPGRVQKRPSRDKYNRFFDDLDTPLTKLASDLGLPPDYIQGLAAFESEWFNDHNRDLNNPLGLTHGGGSNLHPQSVAGAIAYWKSLYGDQVEGATSPEDFAARLEGERDGQKVPGWRVYNSVNTEWRTGIAGTIRSIPKWRARWLASLPKL